MRSLIIAAVTAVVVLSSCSVYRSGQTPDDVYYSPAPEKGGAAAYVEADGDRDEGRRRYNERSYNGYDDYATQDDRWLMMRVRNRYRWSIFDDYSYYSPYSNWHYSPYNSWSYGGWGGFGQPGISLGFGYYDPFGYPSYNRFNDYYYWNSYYNPYYSKVVVVNPRNNPYAYNRIRNFNLNTYNNRNYNNNNRGVMNPHRANQGYNNNNNNRTLGNSFRRVFSNSNNSTVHPGNRDTYRSNETFRNPSSDRPTRVYSPSTNNNSTYSPRNSGSGNSSSSSGSSSGSRPNRR